MNIKLKICSMRHSSCAFSQFPIRELKLKAAKVSVNTESGGGCEVKR